MIYQLYLQSCASNSGLNITGLGANSETINKNKLERTATFYPDKMTADLIKTGKDTFVGIHTKDQTSMVAAWIKKHDLEKFLTYKKKNLVHNWNYPSHGPKLQILVFNGKVTENKSIPTK